MPLILIVTHKEGAVWMQMNSGEIEATLLLFFEEELELIENLLK